MTPAADTSKKDYSKVPESPIENGKSGYASQRKAP